MNGQTPDSVTSVLMFPLILIDQHQASHHLRLEAQFWGNPDPDSGDVAGLDLHLIYQDGSLATLLEATPTLWRAQCDYPIEGGDEGHVEIGLPRRELPPLLVGRGLGTLMQSMLVAWVLEQPCAPLGQLTLAGEDATSEAAIERRWRFWTSFGIAFTDSQDSTHKVSVPMSSWALKTPLMPSFHREGWQLSIPEDLKDVFGLTHSTRNSSSTAVS